MIAITLAASFVLVPSSGQNVATVRMKYCGTLLT
jgi:hypothetical protein